MRKAYIFLLILLFPLTAAASDLKVLVGAKGSYKAVPIKFKSTDAKNTVRNSVLALSASVEVDETYTFSLLGGIDFTSVKDPVTFTKVPFSIVTPSFSKRGLYLGAAAEAFPFELSGFELGGRIRGDLYMPSSESWKVTLRIVEGQFKADPTYGAVSVDLLGRKKLNNGLLLYGGFSFLQSFGKIKGTETIEDLSGKEDLKIKNRFVPGLVSGLSYDFEDYLRLTAEASLINTWGMELSLSYIF